MIGLFLKQNTLNPVSESPSDASLECQLSYTRQVCLWLADDPGPVPSALGKAAGGRAWAFP